MKTILRVLFPHSFYNRKKLTKEQIAEINSYMGEIMYEMPGEAKVALEYEIKSDGRDKFIDMMQEFCVIGLILIVILLTLRIVL